MQQVLNYTKAIVYVIASEHIVYDYIMRMLVKIMALTECQTSKPILSFFLDSYMRKGRSQFAPPPESANAFSVLSNDQWLCVRLQKFPNAMNMQQLWVSS